MSTVPRAVTATTTVTASKAVLRAQQKLDAAIAHLKHVQEQEANRAALKAQKAKEKAVAKAVEKARNKTDMAFQTRQALPLLVQFCLKLNRAYTKELLDEFLRWKFDPESGAANMPNLYVKVYSFMNQLPPVEFVPVFVKTMTGDLISLDYSPSLDRQQLPQQLSLLDPDRFPRNQTIVVRIVEDEKEPVCEEELFGCIVVPGSLITCSPLLLVKESCWLDQPGLSYQFFAQPVAFHLYRTIQGHMKLPTYPSPLSFTHFFEKGTFVSDTHITKEYDSLCTLLEENAFYDHDTMYQQRYRITLTSEAVEEVLSLFQAVRRM